MRIAIRTDASHTIGSGHLTRCLTLAHEMRKAEWDVIFISSGREKKWVDLVEKNKFECEIIETALDLKFAHQSTGIHSRNTFPSDSAVNWQQDVRETDRALKKRNIDWLIVDHYGLDLSWESALRDRVNKIMVIDDLANRRHDCDILLDSVYGRKVEDYFGLVSTKCRMLLGTKYALLRPEYRELREYALEKRVDCQTVKRVLISLGGADRLNLTSQVVDLLKFVKWRNEVKLDIVLGLGYQYKKIIERQVQTIPFEATVNIGVDDMAFRITKADFGVGTFGVSTWERFCLGLPSINIVTEANQMNAVSALYQHRYAGMVDLRFIDKKLISTTDEIISSIALYRKITDACSHLVDGKGPIRVARQIKPD